MAAALATYLPSRNERLTLRQLDPYGHPKRIGTVLKIEAAKARALLQSGLGDIRMVPGKDGSLWARYSMQPAIFLTACTGDRGEAICAVPAVRVRSRVK
jgi:hypothetical protein